MGAWSLKRDGPALFLPLLKSAALSRTNVAVVPKLREYLPIVLRGRVTPRH
jgi:hypothetical protein